MIKYCTICFRCTFCGSQVEEDMSTIPKKDSRLMLARFNEQLQPLYDLLREVEGIRLAPEILEPEPVDIDVIRGIIKPNENINAQIWSGEATRSSSGFVVEEARVDITIGGQDIIDSSVVKKERPIWMTESTVVTKDSEANAELMLEKVAQDSNTWQSSANTLGTISKNKKDNEDNIYQYLLTHEKQVTKNNIDAVKNINPGNQDSSGDSSGEDDDEIDRTEIRMYFLKL
jgi:transcription initiation factor TFIIE subunit alpha